MLAEFDLDAPEERREDRHRFRLQTRTVTALFERCFTPPDGTGKAWKVLVEIVTTIRKPNVRDLLGALTVQVEGDVMGFFALSADGKRRQALNWLYTGIEVVTRVRGWSIAPFEVARESVLAARFENTWTWKRPILNSSGSITAEVFVEHGIEAVKINIRFRNLLGEVLQTTLIATDIPTEFAFSGYFGNLHWADDCTAVLTSKSGDRSWPVTVDERLMSV